MPKETNLPIIYTVDATEFRVDRSKIPTRYFQPLAEGQSQEEARKNAERIAAEMEVKRSKDGHKYKVDVSEEVKSYIASPEDD